ncbi:TPA: hypothetical protein RG419_003704 [Morganella morganii]|nr:hypothetical protein [Morganella morganii]
MHEGNIRNDHAETQRYLTSLGAFYSEKCSPLVLYSGEDDNGFVNVLNCNGTTIIADAVMYNKALTIYKKSVSR